MRSTTPRPTARRRRASRATTWRRSDRRRSATGRRAPRRCDAEAGAGRDRRAGQGWSAEGGRGRMGRMGVGTAGIARRRGNLVDEGPLHVVLAQLIGVSGPDTRADGVEKGAATDAWRLLDRPSGRFRGGTPALRARRRQSLRRDRYRSATRCPRGTSQAGFARPVRRARRQSGSPRSRDRDHADSSETRVRRTSTPRANGWRSAR